MERRLPACIKGRRHLACIEPAIYLLYDPFSMELEGYKNVFADGLPTEDGAYLVVLSDDESIPHLLVRYKGDDGKTLWASTDRRQINEENILLYKRVLITPDSKRKHK